MPNLRKNFALKVFSLTLALLGWAYVRFVSGAFATHLERRISVPILIANLPVGYVATHVSAREAVVRVSLKPDQTPPNSQEIRATVDLSNALPGLRTAPVELSAPNLAVQSLSPASISLDIERLESHVFPVVVHYAGAPPVGIVVGSPTIAPAAVDVRGPTSALARIAAVRVNVPVSNTPQRVDEMIRPVAVDALGTEINDVQVAPNLVRVTLKFNAAGGGSH